MYLKEPYRTTASEGPCRAKNAYPLGFRVISGQRYLHPELGRWTRRDPIREGGGFNLHSFCRNQTVNLLDALGERGCRVGGRYWVTDCPVPPEEKTCPPSLGSTKKRKGPKFGCDRYWRSVASDEWDEFTGLFPYIGDLFYTIGQWYWRWCTQLSWTEERWDEGYWDEQKCKCRYMTPTWKKKDEKSEKVKQYKWISPLRACPVGGGPSDPVVSTLVFTPGTGTVCYF